MKIATFYEKKHTKNTFKIPIKNTESLRFQKLLGIIGLDFVERADYLLG